MCAKLESGTITCWGTDKAPHPDLGPGKIADVEVAATHGCVRKEDGAVRCWNAETWGGIGTDALNKPVLPGPVSELGTGDAFACVIGRDKQVACWGANDLGQLGKTPDYDVHETPEIVPGTRDAESLAIGEASACAILSGGRVVCWGANPSGELGLGKTSISELPSNVSALSGVRDLCFASAHACALTNDDEMLCWGMNGSGQLGDGTHEARLKPVRVSF